MALLRLALAATAVLASGCSLVLDPNDLTAAQRDISGDIFNPDASDAADTKVADTAPVDTTAPADTAPPADTSPVDTASPGPQVVIHASGVGGCELDYSTVIVTECPETCPSKGGWKLIFDATASTGVTSFDWKFSATESYDVEPKSATGGRVEVTLDVPSCALLQGATLGSATIYATLTVNGGPTQYDARIDFSVRHVSSCGTTRGSCASP